MITLHNKPQLEFSFIPPKPSYQASAQQNCQHRYIYATIGILPDLDDSIEEFICKKCGHMQE